MAAAVDLEERSEDAAPLRRVRVRVPEAVAVAVLIAGGGMVWRSEARDARQDERDLAQDQRISAMTQGIERLVEVAVRSDRLDAVHAEQIEDLAAAVERLVDAASQLTGDLNSALVAMAEGTQDRFTAQQADALRGELRASIRDLDGEVREVERRVDQLERAD